ncbi:hypothetical protein [Synechococcus sp. MU1651]|uniref:hypothetical protein n=1 Tax=Synechococcus sp. MU1651 TaxID=2508353 RepID=UPI002026E106|nr:hypothetical protein [Synechococcus sp. MU1651]
MESALSAISGSMLLDSLDEAEVLIDQTTNDSVELLKGVSISPKMVMKELSRVLTESADLLIVLTQDFGIEKLDDILQQNPEQLMVAPLLAT